MVDGVGSVFRNGAGTVCVGLRALGDPVPSPMAGPFQSDPTLSFFPCVCACVCVLLTPCEVLGLLWAKECFTVVQVYTSTKYTL